MSALPKIEVDTHPEPAPEPAVAPRSARIERSTSDLDALMFVVGGPTLLLSSIIATFSILQASEAGLWLALTVLACWGAMMILLALARSASS